MAILMDEIHKKILKTISDMYPDEAILIFPKDMTLNELFKRFSR